jgi:VWFA-related protein
MVRFALLLSGLLLAQDPTIRVTTRLVQVNVVVRDGHGPVAGLAKKDFKIFDKGKEQQIALFSVLSSSTDKTPAKPALPTPPGVFTNRLKPHDDDPTSATVLLIDALNTEMPDQQEAQQQILKFLDSLDLNRRVAIYLLSGHSLRVLQDFTDDPALLKKAIAGFHGESSAILEGTRVEGCGRHECEGLHESRDAANVDRVHLTLAALSQIANHLAHVPGRKSLLWISSSFPSFLLHVNRDQWDINRENRTFLEEITRATRALSAADVAIYPIDDRGILARPDVDVRRRGLPGSSFSSRNGRLPGSMPIDIPEGLDSMRDLADGTGGIAFVNTNDIKNAIGKAFADADLTYTLGFYADSSAVDGFHEIKVKVDRPGLDIRYRKGYLAAAVKPPSEDDVAALLNDAVASALDSTAIGLIAAVDNTRVSLQVNFADLSLEKQNGKWTGAIDVVYVAESAGGRNIALTSKRITLDLNADLYAAKRRDGLVLEQVVERPKGTARIRIAVMDERSGATGSVSIPVR